MSLVDQETPDGLVGRIYEEEAEVGVDAAPTQPPQEAEVRDRETAKDETAGNGQADTQAAEMPRKAWPWVVAGLVLGGVLGSLAVFDFATLGKIVAGLLLLGANACVAIHAGRLADQLFLSPEQRQAANMESPTAARHRRPVRPRTFISVAISLVVWVGIVVAIDRWIWRLPISLSRKLWLLLPAGAVLLIVGVLEGFRIAWARRSHPAPDPQEGWWQRLVGRWWGLVGWWWGLVGQRLPGLVVSAAVGAVAVVLAVAVAGYFNQRDTDDDVIAVPPIQGLGGGQDGIVYLALGESYSAGEGLDHRIRSADEHCHRAVEAYPMLVARALGGVDDSGSPPLEQSELRIPDGVRLEFRACSGAVSADIDSGLVGGWTAQMDSEPRPDVDLVTITIGGNDVIFSDVVQACMLYDDCLDDQFEPRELDPSRPTIDYPESQELRSWAAEAITRIKPNLARVFGNLRTTYPNARIVVIGYPYLFHEEPSWHSLPDLDCFTVMNRISLNERRDIRTLTDQLNAAVVDVIDENRELRIEPISTVAAWHRHEPCGEWGQFTNAVKPKPQLLSPVDGGSFHPNVQGHRQLARLVSCFLNNVDPPPTGGATLAAVPGSAIPEPLPDETSMNGCDQLLAVP